MLVMVSGLFLVKSGPNAPPRNVNPKLPPSFSRVMSVHLFMVLNGRSKPKIITAFVSCTNRRTLFEQRVRKMNNRTDNRHTDNKTAALYWTNGCTRDWFSFVPQQYLHGCFYGYSSVFRANGYWRFLKSENVSCILQLKDNTFIIFKCWNTEQFFYTVKWILEANI